MNVYLCLAHHQGKPPPPPRPPEQQRVTLMHTCAWHATNIDGAPFAVLQGFAQKLLQVCYLGLPTHGHLTCWCSCHMQHLPNCLHLQVRVNITIQQGVVNGTMHSSIRCIIAQQCQVRMTKLNKLS